MLAAAGPAVAVTHFGLATTPAMFMATVLDGHKYDCAIMLTASHLPPDRNGIKFFTPAGSTDKADVASILDDAVAAQAARSGTPLPTTVSARPHAIEYFDFIPVYARHLADLIRAGCAHPTHPLKPLTGLKIVVDAGNGAGGFFADQVLSVLGADVVGQFLDPDGTFPNHVPNPEDPVAMQMTVDTTKASRAHLGVIFDTDVDRSGVVDGVSGVGINRNRLIAVLARILLREHPGTTIVTDSVTSNGLARFIEEHGGRHVRYKKGYKNVIDKAVEMNAKGTDTQLAMETSGHGACKENYMLDDGCYLAVKIIIELVRLRLAGDERGIGSLLGGLAEPLEEREFRLDFFDKGDYASYGRACVEAFAQFANTVDGWAVEEENHEGFRVRVEEGDGREGWLLLRPSLHDPLLPLNVESEVSGGTQRIASVLVDRFFPSWTNVNVSTLATAARVVAG
jgi:phosphomannomutase